MSGRAFPETHWSVVTMAARAGEPQGESALASLCGAYWYPLFSHLRARGHSRHEAEDLLQGFFVHLFEKQALGRADRLKGTFRGFLLGCLKYYLANQRELASAHKRGGLVKLVSLDFDEAESRLVAGHSNNPSQDVEREFDRQWALLIMERSLARLQTLHLERLEVFHALKGYLTASDDTRYETVAQRLGVTESSVKVTVHRMRAQFREILRAEVAATVSAPHEIDAELRHLVGVVSTETP
jgi:DNA-directed RNA polymerase specialized sigma24 family protein